MSDALSAGADLSKVYGESTRCPACGAFAKTVPHPDHRWVCAVCGSPRVVMPEGEPLPEEAAVALREAANAQRQAAIQRMLSWALGIPAAIALVLAAVLALASLVASGIIIASGVVLALLASRASRKGATERKRLRSAVERAYEEAIAQMSSKNLTNAQIASGLRIAEADVEAAMAVQGQVRVAVPKRIAESVAETESETETETETETAAEAEKKA